MKANELRVGNYIWDDIFYYSIKGIGDVLQGEIIDVHNQSKAKIEDFYESGQTHSLNLENGNPIPLTEDWLLKFGFKKHGYLKFLGDAYQRYIIGRNGIYTLDKKVYIFEVNEHDLCEIYFVHQLQNLYFALTGEELISKE